MSGERARGGEDEGDPDREMGTVDESSGYHLTLPAGFAAPAALPSVWARSSPAAAFMLDRIRGLAGPGETGRPGRTRCRPSAITFSPGESPLITAAMVEVDCPSWIRRCSALLSGPTTKT